MNRDQRRCRLRSTGGLWALMLLGGLGPSWCWGQAPTVEPTEPARMGSMPASLGSSPGSQDSTLGNAPGSGAGSLGGGDQGGVLGGRAGTSTPRVPTALSNPAGSNVPGAEARIVLPTPLQVPAPPVYGTLDFPTVAVDTGTPGGLTLDQALERLVRDNLQLRSQAFELPQAQADILTASLRANPILYADAQLVPYGSYSAERPGGPVQYDLNISHPVDATGKRRARMTVAGQAKRVLEAQFQDAVRLQIANLYAAHLSVLATRQRLRYAQAGVEGLDELLKPLEARVKAGQITPAEYNRVVLQREAAALALRDEEENLQQARRTLATLLNISPDAAESLEVQGTIRDDGPVPPPLPELIGLAIANRPDLQAFRLGINRAQADVRLAEANRLNDLYVLYQPYTFQDNTPFGNKSATSWALGVTVPLPVYNRNQGNIQRARINVAQTQTELADLQRRIVTEVQQAEKEYRVTREAVQRIETQLRPAAEQVLRTVRRQYEEGSIGVIEFVTARQEYNQVVKQYLETLIRHRQSMLALNTAIGYRLLP